MKKLFVFALLFCVAGVFLNSCDKDEPSNQITFDRYDVDSRPLGTAAAWDIYTQSQFNTAAAQYNDYDVFYMHTDSITTFTVPDVWIGFKGNWFEEVNLFRVNMTSDSDPKPIIEIPERETGTWTDRLDLYDCNITNIRFVPDPSAWPPPHWATIIGNAATYSTIEGVEFNSPNDWDDAGIFLRGNIHFDSCDDIAFGEQQTGTATINLSSYQFAANVCDTVQISLGAGNGVVVNSWKYDDAAFTYEDFDFLPGHQIAWIAGDSLVVVMPVVNEAPAVTGVLKYGDGDCTEYSVTMDNSMVGSTPIPYGRTILTAIVDISWATGSPKKTVYWSVEATLCDETIVFGCTLKMKPRSPEDDPRPQQE